MVILNLPFGLSRLDTFAFAVTAILLVTAFVAPHLGSRGFTAVESVLRRIARRRVLSILLVGLLAFIGSMAVSLGIRRPRPAVHDEFSYLLAADTFASGRLTNPPHPLWEHFESMHIIQQPTYASKYPPAQGLFLALGQAISGYPMLGLWISSALACAALCWMLQAWLPPWWALLGALLAVINLGIYGYWSQSYWGGMVAAFAGALVFGALRRMIRRPRLRYTVCMGLGLAILANSRPLEGLLASLPVMAVLLLWMLGKNRPPVRTVAWRVVLPLLGLLILTGGAMGFYNYRVTGHSLLTPYKLYDISYANAPPFFFTQPWPPPSYHHEVLREFNQGWAVGIYYRFRMVQGLLHAFLLKLWVLWQFYVGPVFTIPLMILPWLCKRRWPRVVQWLGLLMVLALTGERGVLVSAPVGLACFAVALLSQGAALALAFGDRWVRFAVLTCGVVMLGMFITTWTWPHYIAPVTSLILLIVLQAMRRLRRYTWRGQPAGLSLVRAIPLVCIIVLIGRIVAFPLALHSDSGALTVDLVDPNDWSRQRTRFLSELSRSEGDHLIIVRYRPDHYVHDEWVHNRADIDHAKVVWARDMGLARNHALANYFKDRKVWLLYADENPPRLIPGLPAE